MTREEILKLAASCVNSGEDVITLAYEMLEFLEGEEEQEEDEENDIEQKILNAFGFTNPAKQFAEAAEYIKEERENARKRVEEIINEIGESDSDEFHVDRNKLPAKKKAPK